MLTGLLGEHLTVDHTWELQVTEPSLVERMFINIAVADGVLMQDTTLGCELRLGTVTRVSETTTEGKVFTTSWLYA